MIICGLDVEPELVFDSGSKLRKTMKTMKTMKTCFALIGAAGILSSTSVFADLVTLTQTGLGNANGGGEFKAVTSANGTFSTFCLSIGTLFTPGTQYSYTVNPTINAVTTPPNGSPVAYGTAVLYNDFLNGGNHTAMGANGIQAAIWFCEQDLFINTHGTTYGDSNFYVTDTENGGNVDLTSLINYVLDPLHLSQAQLLANGNGAFGVEVMNLKNSNGSPAQPQLIQVPEASTVIAGALLLLPLGVSALRIVRKSRVA